MDEGAPENKVIRERVCRQCSANFLGGPRAWYCPACRIKRRRESDRKFRGKGRKADRPIGSTGKCIVCGNDYIVNSSRQKYCPECAHDAIRQTDREASKKWNRDHKDTHYPSRCEKRKVREKTCSYCGKKFDPQGTPRRLCSDECREKSRKESQRRSDAKRTPRKRTR